MELTELMELRKNMLVEHGAYRAYRAEKENTHGAWSLLSIKLIELRKNMLTKY